MVKLPGEPGGCSVVAVSMQNQQIKAPSLCLALTEGHRALLELSALAAAAPLLDRADRGDGHPVLVLPGFATSDRAMRLLRRYLKKLGYEAHAWDLGRNLGSRAVGAEGEKLAERLDTIHEDAGRKVSLVGWSLGGIMARELAKQAPDKVRQVITLASPFTGDPQACRVTRLYEQVTGERLDSPENRERADAWRKSPPVPCTAIFSRADGIVSWRNCIEPAGPLTDNVEVYGSHFGMSVNPAVLHVLADRLAQPEGDWKPFERRGWRASVYPFSGHRH
jgi:pimeloyl-ACP methyl ester carboxylesterase